MTNSNKTFTLTDFYQAVEDKDVKELCIMVRSGVLTYIGEDDSITVLKKLFELRDLKLTAEITKHINYIPIEVISDINLQSPKLQAYISDLLAKYVGKFNYKDYKIAGQLFEAACKAQCPAAIRFLLKKGVGESDYPRLISSSAKIASMISEVKVKALDKDTISTFFMEAALSDFPEDRILSLMEHGFDVRVINSEGLNVCEAFRKGIDTYQYSDDKKGATEKSRDESSYLVLKKIYDDTVNGLS